MNPGIARKTRVAASAILMGLLLTTPALVSLQGCTDLSESPLSAITPENFYRNEIEVIGGLASVYAELRGTVWGYYNLSQISTEEMIVPTRGSDWFDNGRWLEIHRQTWSPNSPSGLDDINGVWNNLFTGVARANVLVTALQNVTVADQARVDAEVRMLRAFYYYLLMDMFGGVPIVEDTEIMPRERNTRAEVFQFIVNELTAIRGELPAQWPAHMHGRMTQGAVDAVLASMHLNAAVFMKDQGIDAAAYNSCQTVSGACEAAIAAADRILNSGIYSLSSDWRSNFRPTNQVSPENILVVKFLNEPGLGFEMFYRPLHYHQLSPAPWNGFATLAETYYAFDTLRIETVPVPGTTRTSNLLVSNDRRHQIFLAGPQRDLEADTLVRDRPGNPLFFTPEIRDATAASEGEGARILKWIPDPNKADTHHANDYAYFRLAEIYLIKAEALNELGRTDEAVALVNQVRERVFPTPRPLPTGGWTQASFRDAILRERHMELTGEAKRRQDLIRHGKFTRPWSFKQQGQPHLVLMPIPQTQIDANPLLAQNPGY